jgi:phosphatidylglycerol phospholipase C
VRLKIGARGHDSIIALHIARRRRTLKAIFFFWHGKSSQLIGPPWAAPFIQALQRPDGSRLPQAIAHRGDKSKFPENTLAAFRSAVELGVHAVETDLHLTKDKVVVLSHVSLGPARGGKRKRFGPLGHPGLCLVLVPAVHTAHTYTYTHMAEPDKPGGDKKQDASLQRCFGIDKKIADCDWAYLQTLRTARAPHEPLPRLGDLLAYLARPENESIWVLLDIKASTHCTHTRNKGGAWPLLDGA